MSGFFVRVRAGYCCLLGSGCAGAVTCWRWDPLLGSRLGTVSPPPVVRGATVTIFCMLRLRACFYLVGWW